MIPRCLPICQGKFLLPDLGATEPLLPLRHLERSLEDPAPGGPSAFGRFGCQQGLGSGRKRMEKVVFSMEIHQNIHEISDLEIFVKVEVDL